MFRPRSQVGPFLNLTHDWSARPWAHTNSSFEHLPGVAILELGEAQVTERFHEGVRQPITASCADGHRLHSAPLSRQGATKRGSQSSRHIERDNGKGEPHVLPVSTLP